MNHTMTRTLALTAAGCAGPPEALRPPRLPLRGADRERVEAVVAGALANRPARP